MEERYGVTFLDDDCESLDELIDEIQPTIIANEFQAQMESSARLIPSFCIFFYLADYGYDYALNFGNDFSKVEGRSVWRHWRELNDRYGGH